MSAGLPLLLITLLSNIILAIWAFYGKGRRIFRLVAAGALLIGQLACWVIIMRFGVFHDYGSAAMGAAFLLSTVTFFVPYVGNKFVKSDY